MLSGVKLFENRCTPPPAGHFLHAQKVPKDATETGWFLEIAEAPLRRSYT